MKKPLILLLLVAFQVVFSLFPAGNSAETVAICNVVLFSAVLIIIAMPPEAKKP